MNFRRNVGKAYDSSSVALFIAVTAIIILNSVAKANPSPLYGIAASVDAANEIDQQRKGISSNLANSNNRAPPIRRPVLNAVQSVDLRPPVRRQQYLSSSNIRSTPRPTPYPQRWFIEYFFPENWQFWRWRTSSKNNKENNRRKSKERPYRRHQQPPLENNWRKKQPSQYYTGT